MTATPAAEAPRPAGRPSQFEGGAGVRRSLWVDEKEWETAKAKAATEGRDLSAVIRELVAAYGQDRVVLRRQRKAVAK